MYRLRKSSSSGVIGGFLGFFIIADSENTVMTGDSAGKSFFVDQPLFLHREMGPWFCRKGGGRDRDNGCDKGCDNGAEWIRLPEGHLKLSDGKSLESLYNISRRSRSCEIALPAETGILVLPAERVHYLLPGDVSAPELTIGEILDYLSDCDGFRKFGSGLQHLLKVLHCLDSPSAAKLLLGMVAREPALYSIVTDSLFGLTSLPLLSRDEIFQFLTTVDDTLLGRSWNELGQSVQLAVRRGLSRRRAGEVLEIAGASHSGHGVSALKVLYRNFLENRFARFLDVGEEEPPLFQPPDFSSGFRLLEGIGKCSFTGTNPASECGFDSVMPSGYGMADGTVILCIEPRAAMVSIYRDGRCSLYRNLPPNSYMIVPGDSGCPLHMAVWTGESLHELIIGVRGENEQ
ncbi:MAG: hypothetical protein CVV64_12185 [Candidatus Wallbacteria bacterium HGW-Wallbacteria-1]|jgi:hypothetical protein|uniref:Uncharacterized protein n=1 Tax=Candidatus Wallbacteria bacterium HGW-Wallbacteria-1 TaxID=2013854 RepID=A0A2N1PNH6_9BACT|nr:MAG: hypothetical protein CVV64_12185 [Candidatus Wallbacteria bacterium HGW-Wallbacteria-1]